MRHALISLLLFVSLGRAQEMVAPMVLMGPSGPAPVTFGIGQSTTSANTTFSFTCDVTDGMLEVRISTAFRTVSGVTFNGDALTYLDHYDEGGFYSAIYYIVAPDNGTYDIVVTLSSASSNTIITATSWNKVNQSTPFVDVDHSFGTGTGPSITVSSATGAAVIDVCTVDWGGTATATVGAGQTQQANQTTEYTLHAASREAGAASVTMSWTLSQSKTYSIVAAAVNPM